MAPGERGALMALTRGSRGERGPHRAVHRHDMDVVFRWPSGSWVLHQGRVIGGRPRPPPCAPTARCRPCTSRGAVMLELADVHAVYGRSHVLQALEPARRGGRGGLAARRTAPASPPRSRRSVGVVEVTAGEIRFEGRSRATCRRTAWPGSGSASCPRTAGSSRTSACSTTSCRPRGRRRLDVDRIFGCFRGCRSRGASAAAASRAAAADATYCAHADDRASPLLLDEPRRGWRRWSWPRSLTSWPRLRRQGLTHRYGRADLLDV